MDRAHAEATPPEERALDFEIKSPKEARGKVRLKAYALYHVCDDKGGQCRFLRLDVPIEVKMSPSNSLIKAEEK